jgi:hypothetical protein
VTIEPSARFDAGVLEAFRTAEEVDVETWSPADGVRQTIVWIVVVEGVPFLRSVRGSGGRWYREIREEPAAAIHLQGRRVPVRAVLADDPSSVTAVSEALAAKYPTDPAMPAMLRPEVLGTTLRLEPA